MTDPFTATILARFPGATIIDRAALPEVDRPVVGGWHQINQPCFSVLAPENVRRGWSVFPQTRYGRRGPGEVGGMPLAWKEFQDRLPTAREIAWWSVFCPSHNVALILGAVSGNTFAVDVDVSDPELSGQVQELASRYLGRTPFRRVGRAPRIVLIYRGAPAKSVPLDQRIHSRRLPFTRQLGEATDALEILAHGKAVTIHGIHHGTGGYFKWLGEAQPHTHGPEQAPLVTQAQMDRFIDAVNAVRPFSVGASRAVDTTWTYDEKAGLHRPMTLGDVEWEVVDGRVTGGREAFVFRLVSETVRANELAARDFQAGHAQICALVEREFLHRAELGGKWTGLHLKHEIAAKVRASVRHHIEKNSFRRVRPGAAVAVDGEGEVQHAPSIAEVTDAIEAPELATLRHRHQRRDFKLGKAEKRAYGIKRGPDGIRALERALLTDDALRTQAAQTATAEIRGHLDGWIDGLYGRAGERRAWESEAGRRARTRTRAKADRDGVAFDEEAEVRIGQTDLGAAPISILKGDAGVGKTSSFWRALARAIETRGRLGYPVGFAMPSHANIENSLEGAVREQLAWEHSVSEALAEGQKAGLKVVVFRGRLRTNCGFKAQIQSFNAASIQAERLCRSRIDVSASKLGVEAKWEEVLCPMFAVCEYQLSLIEIAKADVVLFASAYLSVQAPAALSKALLALVVDERPYSGLLNTNSARPMPLAVLGLGRPAPRLTDAEIAPLLQLAKPKEAIEMAREGYLADRAEAIRIALPHLQAMDAGKAVLALHRHRIGSGRIGLHLARSAYVVCSRGSNLSKDVRPGMDEAAAVSLAATPQGEGIWDERRFWSLVIDRLEALRDDEDMALAVATLRETGDEEAWAKAIAGLRAQRTDEVWQAAVDAWAVQYPDIADAPRRAKGERDARLQVVTGGEGALCVRMSWRGTPSFPKIPLMMLDASAEPLIVRKVWTDRAVETLQVRAPCHMRVVVVTGSTFSDFSMMPGRTRKIRGIKAASERVHLHREVVTRLAGVHGNGKIIVGGNKGVMGVLRAGWKPPANIDFVHNGAMRGLDQFKNHEAAILFGRLELPPRAIDAYVACLTYDDDEPEQPVDALGTGQDADGKDLQPTVGEKVVAMRDGRDITLRDTTYVGAWARLVQSQWREEEVRQFGARLRPVHRLGRPPVAYIACTAIPEGMIVDDVVDMRDMLSIGPDSTSRPWEIARETDGVLDVRIGWDAREDLAATGDTGYVEEILGAAHLGTPGHPEAQGTTRIRWRLHGGPWSTGSVLTWSDDPEIALARAVAREQGLSVEEVLDGVEIDRLWRGLPRAVSGTRAPDAIDRANLGLEPDAELSREEARARYADEEARDRFAMMQRVRLELAGFDTRETDDAGKPIQRPSEAEIEAALATKRIARIDWSRLKPWEGADRKLEAVPLAVRVIMARYGADDADMSDVDA